MLSGEKIEIIKNALLEINNHFINNKYNFIDKTETEIVEMYYKQLAEKGITTEELSEYYQIYFNNDNFKKFKFYKYDTDFVKGNSDKKTYCELPSIMSNKRYISDDKRHQIELILQNVHRLLGNDFTMDEAQKEIDKAIREAGITKYEFEAYLYETN